MYLTGGLNHECNKEIAQLRFTSDGQTQWANIPYYSNDKIIGRCRHTSCAYNDKVYMFGGCFMFNMKRQIRECTSQLVIYDTIEDTLNIIKTKGISIQPRKDHCAAIIANSMIVYGGQFENSQVSNEMLNLDLQYNDWSRLYFKGMQIEPFYQAKCVSVINKKKRTDTTGTLEQQLTRMSDAILEGIYYFGGKN